jgi:ATP diphosphatase
MRAIAARLQAKALRRRWIRLTAVQPIRDFTFHNLSYALTEKAERRRERGDERSEAGLLDGIMAGLPALARADKLARKAAKVGFDWADPAQVVRKIEEEVGEIRGALDGGSRGEIEEEIGDLLFAVANLARHAGIDAESALRGANAKFERRFRAIEQALAASGRTAADASVDDMEELWAQAKTAERRSA